MSIVRSRYVLVVTALVMLAAGLLGSFPHGHTAAPVTAAAYDHDAGTHPPRPVRCIESDDRFGAAASCALCLFQRNISQSWMTPAPSAVTLLSDGDVVAQAERLVIAASISPGDPRAPPTI